MNKLKNNKGITLVALIITIIVLLILAMVSIRLVMNGGIIDRAEKGTKAYTEAEIGEQIKLAYAEYQMGQYQTPVNIQSRLQEIFGNDNVQDVSVANGKISVKIKVNGEFKTYEYDASTGVAGEKQPGIGDLVTKDNYGDYIDLGQDVVKTSATTDDWRILYNDKNGHVYAILADYLPNSNAAVKAAGFKNDLSGSDEVNDTYGTYNVYSSTSRQNLLDRLNHATAWNSLIPSSLVSSGASVKGATTAEIIMASYNEKYGTSLAYTSYPYLYIDADSSKGVDTLYMPHPGSAYDNCYGYWLASPYAGDANIVWSVIYSGNVDNRDYYYDAYCGVRPVVSLPSNIQVTKNGNIWTVVQ